jgi:hypothetical protein
MKAIVPGNARASGLALRMQSRAALTQMPPLGTAFTDVEGLALITRWIDSDLRHPKETHP